MRVTIGEFRFDDWVRSGAWQGSRHAARRMLPALARDVIQVALDPDVSPSRLATIVQKDPVLAARVIRLANSAGSAAAVEIAGIRDAIVRVGTRAVRNVVTAACLMSRVRDPQISPICGPGFVDHSIGAAYLALEIAQEADTSADEAFACGLLHDLGKLLLATLACEFRRMGGSPTREEVDAVVAEHHARCGGLLLRGWNLPASLCEAVAWHHAPDQAGAHQAAASVAYAANRLAHRYGFGCEIVEWDPIADPVASTLHLGEDWLDRIDAYIPGLFEIARQTVG
ncbi:MAG: HDOD domain-containing protein [Acidobacteria bacterium]|nr:HDOD domain-containing protein [Acidobacteriota bacterium]